MPDIAVWNKCDNKCVMCTNASSFALQDSRQYRLKPQIEKLELYLKGKGRIYLKNSDNAGYVNLTGGEPTLHPEIFQLLAYFRRRLPGTPITLLTNGRRFSDAAFVERFLRTAKPPFSVAVALHGPSAGIHDAVAGCRGAFSQTVRGLKNLMSAASGIGLEIRIILHKKTIAALPGTLSFLLKRLPDTSRYSVTVIHYEIEGMSEENHASVALKFGASRSALRRSLPLIKRFSDLRLYHFPLCQVVAELRPLCRITLPSEDRIYPGACARCAAKKKCLGLMREYYAKFGDSELKPILE